MKRETITFKADSALAEALRGMPGRSDFLRAAVLSALKNTCPLCKGSGILTVRQMEHWQTFSQKHHFVKCGECDEYQLVCNDESHMPSCHHRHSRSKKA